MPNSRRSRLLSVLGLYVLGPAAFCVAIAVVLIPAPSRAKQPGPTDALNGTWRLAGTIQQAEQTIAQAIEPAIAPLAPDIQRLARVRIAESTWVPQTITVDANTARIAITLAGAENRTFESPPGQPQNVYSRSGVRAQMIQQFRPDGGIEQRFQAMDGTQYNIFSTHGSQLLLDVLMQSRRLQGEVRFRVTYQR